MKGNFIGTTAAWPKTFWEVTYIMNMKLSGQDVLLPEQTLVGLPPESPKPVGFRESSAAALDAPLDLKPLAQWDLKGKKVCIMVDDWGRPTLAGEFLPDALNRLNAAGARDEDITIVTAGGMHDPMGDEDMRRKVGDEAFMRVRCVSHDGGNQEMLSFVGITALGTPVWVNRYVAQADFKIAFGRIYPHCTYGYEGGYKMIVPGVASFETIVRDHSLNYSDFSNYGIVKDNPSRGEANAVGRLVGLDFVVNFVMNWDAQAVSAFGGSPEAVFKAGVAFGQRKVWCCTTGGKKMDISILCNRESEDLSLSNNPTYYIGLALGVTKPEGIVISTMDYLPKKKNLVAGYDLSTISFSELVRLHEKRNWLLSDREVQHVIKSIRGAFYERRIFEQRPQKLFLVSDSFPRSTLERWNARQFPTIQAAYDAAVQELGNPSPDVLALPDAKNTLPLMDYDY